jgi:hypothetical protein
MNIDRKSALIEEERDVSRVVPDSQTCAPGKYSEQRNQRAFKLQPLSR